MKSFFKEFLWIIVMAVGLFLLLQVGMRTTIIRYYCMEPGIQEGQRVIINKMVYYFRQPMRGDVIVFQPPFETEEPFIKRIIGLPGEAVEIRQGVVYIHSDGNAFALDEVYTKEPAAFDYYSTPIPEGEYLVLGDNRNNSDDSRGGWMVDREAIVGKAWLSIWPLNRLGVVSNPLLEMLPRTMLVALDVLEAGSS
ncbi:signal peptidase I [Chloroflexota bacterium]